MNQTNAVKTWVQPFPSAVIVVSDYADYPMVLINLETLRWDAMPDIVERAWRIVATPRLIKEFDAASSD